MPPALYFNAFPTAGSAPHAHALRTAMSCAPETNLINFNIKFNVEHGAL
jgi:hypothetical protein